ncbi:hypothetical protein DOE78_20675 [Bacillus sp. Y1]|nr:hypothetical protein DOE78_20675 [Bacillus sp. Y1]
MIGIAGKKETMIMTVMTMIKMITHGMTKTGVITNSTPGAIGPFGNGGNTKTAILHKCKMAVLIFLIDYFNLP